MKTIKVGDRVRCYGQTVDGAFDCVNEDGEGGIIVGLEPGGLIAVNMDNDYGGACRFLRQQCRLLKPRRKAREVWVTYKPDGRMFQTWHSHPPALPYGGSSVHYREVLPKKGRP